MKRTVFLTVLATLLLAGFLFAQNNPPRINGVIWKPDGISLTYVEGNGSIQGFFIGRFEVTQAQWQAVMGSNPSKFKGDNLPVETVSWDDVQEFLKKLNQKISRNYRLPTEAEWEYAARGGNISEWYEYAGSNNIDEVAWYSKNSGNRTHEVGIKEMNELGIFDMSGNVMEFCEDYWPNRRDHRVIRGGYFQSTTSNCHIASRSPISPRDRYASYGFRVVLSY